MNLRDILFFSIISVAIRFFTSNRWRQHLVLLISILALFWLQPTTPIRYLDFWLPSLTTVITILCWVTVTPTKYRWNYQNKCTLIATSIAIIAISLSRFISLPMQIASIIEQRWLISATRPPQFWMVFLFLFITFSTVIFLSRLTTIRIGSAVNLEIIFLIILLITLKQPEFLKWTSKVLRTLTNQSITSTTSFDLRWLGISYIVFRLIHTLRDHQTNRLPYSNLEEYLIFVLFFPSISAGPIDRLDRFLKDLKQPLLRNSPNDIGVGGQRLLLGLLKKFAIADTLGLIALSPQNAIQIHSLGWMWFVLYAYSLQIYFDFSGYTDIAIGLGRLLGIRLPENFYSPYLKNNITQFWNNWHITLTQWFRAYFFFPFTRYLRSSKKGLPAFSIIFLTQTSTMILIGLWHGVTWNFLLWGLWHGLGLFIQNRYSDWTNHKRLLLYNNPILRKAQDILGVFLTFHFVTLGWVWFALPQPTLSLHVFSFLFGF